MLASKLTSKGQITIPKTVREYLDVDVADTIEFTLLENGNVLMKGKRASATALFSMFKHRKRREPVSVSEMEAAVQNRRKERHAK